MQQDWHWTERYATQPEILDYANHVADRFNLRRDIRFDTRVESAIYDEAAGRWRVTTDAGDTGSAQFVIMATGCLSVFNRPEFPGLGRFEGDTWCTGEWPHEGVDFSGKHTGVIGTGSSAIQSIPVIAEQALHRPGAGYGRQGIPARQRGICDRVRCHDGGAARYPHPRQGRAAVDRQVVGRAAYVPRAGRGGISESVHYHRTGQPLVLSNMIQSIEQHVDFISDCIAYMRRRRHRTIEAEPEAEENWRGVVNAIADETIFVHCNSWYVGANVPGKPRVFMPYLGYPEYVEKCEEVVAGGYEGFHLMSRE